MSRIRFVSVLFMVGLGLFLVNRTAAAAAGCYVLSSDIGYVCDTNPPPSVFVPPPLRPDSILPKMKYGRLADKIGRAHV